MHVSLHLLAGVMAGIISNFVVIIVRTAIPLAMITMVKWILFSFLYECGGALQWFRAARDYLTIRPVALEGEGSNCFSITQLVGQKTL